MDLSYTPQAELFRSEIRDWLEANLPAGWCAASAEGQSLEMTPDERKAFNAGWPAKLFAGGSHAIGKKLVEEAAESWMAARFESNEELSGELSQVLYYVACMMAENGVSLEDVYAKL